MEAIFELIIAIIVQPILWTIQLIVFLFGLVFEFTLMAIFRGTSEAKNSAAIKLKSRRESQLNANPRGVQRLNAPVSLSVLIGSLVFIGFVIYQVVDFQIQQHRKEIPRSIDDQLAVRWKEVTKVKIWGKAIGFADEPFRKWLTKLLEVDDENSLPRQNDLK